MPWHPNQPAVRKRRALSDQRQRELQAQHAHLETWSGHVGFKECACKIAFRLRRHASGRAKKPVPIVGGLTERQVEMKARMLKKREEGRYRAWHRTRTKNDWGRLVDETLEKIDRR